MVRCSDQKHKKVPEMICGIQCLSIVDEYSSG